MRASIALALAAGCCFAGAGCRRSPPAPVDELARALSAAVDYLARLYDRDHLFADPYITCQDQVESCDPAFRELDHAVLVEFWVPDAVRADPRLGEIDRHARRVLDRWLAHWRDRPFDLTAIDLYALFPYYYPGEPTRHMLDEVVRGMNADGDWEPYAAHGPPHRKVTDELWTILALVRNHVADEKVQVALGRKADEAVRILRGDFAAWRPAHKLYGLSHIALALLFAAQAGYDVARYRPIADEAERWLAAAVDEPQLARSTVLMAEALEVLALAGHPDPARLERMAKLLIERQGKDGGWRVDEGPRASGKQRPPAFASAHTTLIALAALDAWAHHAARADERRERRWRMLAGPPPVTAPASGPAPPVAFAESGGRRVAVGFPVKQQRDIDFINQVRAWSENSVLFFRRDQLERQASSEGDRERARALLEVVEQAAAFRPSPRGIRAERDGRTVTLRVALELSGPGADAALAARAARAIEAAWTGDAGAVRVVTRVDARVHDLPAAPNPDALAVFVPLGGGSPYTRRAGDASAIPTTWPARLRDDDLAHEMGHLFGFADEYHVEVRGGFYYVVYDDPSRLMSCPQGRVSADDLGRLANAY